MFSASTNWKGLWTLWFSPTPASHHPKKGKPDVRSSESVLNASSTVYLNQMSWHPLCIAQTCIGHETVLERTATEGTRTRIEFECYHLRGTKHTTTAMFQRRCSSQQPRRKKPTSHMNAPPPGVGNPPPQGEMCHSVWPLHFPVSSVKPGKCQDLPLTGWMKNNSHTCSGQDPAHRNYDWGPLSTLSTVLSSASTGASSFACMGSSVPCSGHLLSHSLTFCKSLVPNTVFPINNFKLLFPNWVWIRYL